MQESEDYRYCITCQRIRPRLKFQSSLWKRGEKQCASCRNERTLFREHGNLWGWREIEFVELFPYCPICDRDDDDTLNFDWHHFGLTVDYSLDKDKSTVRNITRLMGQYHPDSPGSFNVIRELLECIRVCEKCHKPKMHAKDNFNFGLSIEEVAEKASKQWSRNGTGLILRRQLREYPERVAELRGTL